MKKVFALTICICMLLGIAISAFAAPVKAPAHTHTWRYVKRIDNDHLGTQERYVQSCGAKNFPHNHYRTYEYYTKVYKCTTCNATKSEDVYTYGPWQCDPDAVPPDYH